MPCPVWADAGFDFPAEQIRREDVQTNDLRNCGDPAQSSPLGFCTPQFHFFFMPSAKNAVICGKNHGITLKNLFFLKNNPFLDLTFSKIFV